MPCNVHNSLVSREVAGKNEVDDCRQFVCFGKVNTLEVIAVKLQMFY